MYTSPKDLNCCLNRSGKINFTRVIVACLLLFITTACVDLRHYRYDLEPCSLDSSRAGVRECLAQSYGYPNAIEIAKDYTLGFVEFDDQGWLFGPDGRKQMQAVMKKLDTDANSASDITLVIFVHGWKHNAHSDDDNVQEFRGILSRIKRDNETRKVFGIYVGWRGLAVDLPEPLRSSTLIDRKFVAEHVAKGSVRELFARIRHFQIKYGEQNKEKSLVSVILGHSFGGLIVYNAVSQILLNSAVDPDQDHFASPQKVDPFFDVTLLINPAFEASRYEPLHQVAQCRRFVEGQKPVFFSMTSENDSATGFWFHAYRRFATIFSKYYESESHNQEKQAKEAGVASHREYEAEANTNTIGYVERYRTHTLYLEDGAPAPSSEYQNNFKCANVCSSVATVSSVRPSPNGPLRWGTADGRVMLLSHEPRESCDPNNPFWVVKVDRRIIDNHNGFYSKDPNKNYLTDFIAYQVAEKTKERMSAPNRLPANR